MPDGRPGGGFKQLTRRRLLAAGLLSPLMFPGPGRAETSWLVYCGEDFPPYSWADAGRKPRGMDVDITIAILTRLGVPFRIEQMVWSRALASLDQGVPDILFELVPTPERFEKYQMVGPLRDGQTVFAVRKGSALTFDSLDDLKGLTIGIGRRFSYMPEFDQATHFIRDPAPSDQLSLRKLVSGRVDMVVGDRLALAWKAKREGLSGAIRFLPKPLATVPRYIALPRDRVEKADRMRTALAALQADGSIDAIIRRWGETG
ncbi:substrate-binding periplasmic protein [Niveispirillum sp. KHB5.9]|uniref:substrate-binding periplasmic protein n=1 Tax=Niveispirillum sp. KHB5.9 TaxID=3400269 RepID=UPI003A8ADBAB